MTTILTHLLAVFAVLLSPWLGCVFYQRARKRIAAGVPDAKIRLYRAIVVEQIATTAVVVALWLSGRIPAASLGLVAPRSWGWTLAVLDVIVGVLVCSSLLLRPKAEKLRIKVKDHIGALLPDSRQERRWFGMISVGAGISEELVFRGFLLCYVGTYFPQINTLERVLLVSLVFGLAHFYQGRIGVAGTGVAGLALAGLYLMTGSLLLPALVHAAADARVLLIFPPPNSSPAIAMEGKA